MVNKSNKNKKIDNRLLRGLLIILGMFFVGIGIIGIVVPILPTTPFLLLAAACFARSSTRFYNWLLNNKLFGPYIKNYLEGKGIPLKIKIYAISLLWVTILFATYFIIQNIMIRIILLIIAILVSTHIIMIKTKKN